jgi:hypothetical protein
MIDLILINGCGGAGKERTGRELLRKLPRAALLDIKGLSSTNPWHFEDFELGIRNAVSLIRNFAEKGWPQIILVGGVNSSDRLSYLLSELRVKATFIIFGSMCPSKFEMLVG